jgi:hypothetical protein
MNKSNKRTRANQKRAKAKAKASAKDKSRKMDVKIETGDSAYNLIFELCSPESLPLTEELFNDLFINSIFPKRSDFDYLRNEGFLFNPVRGSFVKCLEDSIIEVDKDKSTILDLNFLKK